MLRLSSRRTPFWSSGSKLLRNNTSSGLAQALQIPNPGTRAVLIGEIHELIVRNNHRAMGFGALISGLLVLAMMVSTLIALFALSTVFFAY